jgi:hypothetical protein
MALRPTPRAGILKARVDDPKVQRMLDAIIERVEVLDGLRGDELDQAITYRALGLTEGFSVGVPFPGGTPIVGGTPGPGTGGPVPGPTTAPTNLSVSETFLALLLTWTNPSYNAAHIEIWRSLTDNLSTAQLVGTSAAPLFVDYVGGNATFYYWVRAVATDGTYSPYNDTAGTIGTTGLDPADFEPNITTSTTNLDTALGARIDLIDYPATGLVDRMAAAEGDIIASDASIVTLQSDVSGINTTIAGQTTSINANASSITTNETNIVTLQSDVSGNDSDIASNIAAISVNAASILSLEASIGAIDAGGGETWEFIGTLDGWTAANASLVAGGEAAVFTPSGSNPNMVSPAISRSGGVYTQVVVRVRQTIGGGAWEGTVFYQTSGHGMVSTHRKTIADPSLSLSQWTTLTWDMTNLTEGGTDWEDSTIEAIRLDLVSDNAGKFEVDFVLIAKFSTSAMSEAISALDVRVTTNESGISAQATQIVALESTVDDPSTGVIATSSALSALTTDVSSNDTDIAANSAAIVAVETTVNDGGTGVLANATAISTLETDVNNVEGDIVVQAQSITQLVASIEGGFATMVNSLRTAGEGFGTSFVDADIQAFSIGGRTGVAAINTTSTVKTKFVMRGTDAAYLYIEPGGVYEVRLSFYHNRPTNAGTTEVAVWSHNSLIDSGSRTLDLVSDGAIIGSAGVGILLQGTGTVGGNEWVDMVGYILGSDVDPSRCPDMVVNGDKTNADGYAVFQDGVRLRSSTLYARIALSNYNTAPTFGDDTSTTARFTDLQVRRIDMAAENHAAIQVESTVRASETGDLNALYAVRVELTTGNDPYITGFGLAADVINGVASSSFGIRADQFFITSPNFGSNPGAGPGDNEESKFPFVIDLVDGVAQVGISGDLIVDGTIRATSIIAGSIGTAQLKLQELYAVFINADTITGQLIRTAPSGYRVEIEGVDPGSGFPIWYGSGSKSAPTGLFYVDTQGNVVIKGLLDAGMIKQSYFTPAGQNQSFRIACDYPSNYFAGVYTGQAAHLGPVLTTGYNAGQSSQGATIIASSPLNKAQSLTQVNTGYHTAALRIYSPTYTGSAIEYGRLGSLSENLAIRYSASLYNQFSDRQFWIIVKYQYDSEVERNAFIQHSMAASGMRSVTMVAEEIFITREAAWQTLDIRLGAGCVWDDNLLRGTVQSINLTISTQNFGYADLGSISDVTGATTGATTIVRNPTIIRRYE